MTKKPLTRRKLLAAAAPLAAVPFVGKLALGGEAEAGGHSHTSHIQGREAAHLAGGRGHATGHAAMIGPEVPAVGGPNDLDALLYPPRALPAQPGRVREYTLVAEDKDLEIAPGIFFPAWTYNGTAPGPVIRATEGDTAPRPLPESGLAPAHDPLPRDPPGEHGRRLPGRRDPAGTSPTSSRPDPRACTSTTVTPRR